MGRRARVQVANATYHLTTRSAGKILAYRDAEDYTRFVRILAYVVDRLSWVVHMYCVMPTHWHVVATTLEPNVSAGVHLLNGLYARTFNERHERAGHLWGARYRSPIIETERHAIRVCSYVPVNPVAAGLCARPEDWPWSSYGATIGLRQPPWFLDDEWVLRQFDDHDLEVARRRYRAYVEAAADELGVPGTSEAARGFAVPGTLEPGRGLEVEL